MSARLVKVNASEVFCMNQSRIHQNLNPIGLDRNRSEWLKMALMLIGKL